MTMRENAPAPAVGSCRSRPLSRRLVLLGFGILAVVLDAALLSADGVGVLLPATVIYTASFNTNVLGDEWETQVRRRSEHSHVAVSDGSLRIRTDGGCYTNAAVLDVGAVSGSIRLAYRWEAAASGWYEVPETTVFEDGTPLWEQTHPPRPDGRNVPDGEITGRDDHILDVDGHLELQFAVTPSQYCGASDHEWTEYVITNLLIERA